MLLGLQPLASRSWGFGFRRTDRRGFWDEGRHAIKNAIWSRRAPRNHPTAGERS